MRSPGFSAVSRSSSASTASAASQPPRVELTSGNSLVLRCEVSRSALASHLVVESWKNLENGRVISTPLYQSHFRGELNPKTKISKKAKTAVNQEVTLREQ